jgi:leucyl-tRNA synthetase
MFLEPLEQAKPWNFGRISGVLVLEKLWRLYFSNGLMLPMTRSRQLEIIAQTIKRSSYEVWRFSFNTSVSQFMICVNELSAQKLPFSDTILEPLAVIDFILTPHTLLKNYGALLGYEGSIAAVPSSFLIKTFGRKRKNIGFFQRKMRFHSLPLDLTAQIRKKS